MSVRGDVMDIDFYLDRIKGIPVSDIHFIPQRDEIRVRYRLPQGLTEEEPISREEYGVLLQRVKLKAGMNISEKRLPQDGIIEAGVSGRQLRISTLRSIYGEALTIRLFQERSMTLAQLGFTEEQLKSLETRLYGGFSLLVITGETGSGKSTTLKALIRALTEQGHKVVSVEDPVEISIAGALEVSLNETIGLDYERAIFASLRQDPDYIAIGEIRGRSTCEHCLRAALSGHPVITTLHSGDYELTRMRLCSMSSMPEFVDSVLTLVINQKLVATADGLRRLSARIFEKGRKGVLEI